MTDPQWQLVIHQAAQRELANVTGEVADDLTDRLKQASYHKQPTDCPFICHIENETDLWRVRAEDYRALCVLNKPEIQVLAIGKRNRVYDSIETAKDRAGL